MEFKEAMRIFNRICKGREMCEGCVLSNKCIVLKDCDYSTAEAILAKWALEHPERTIMDDFFAKHPKAPRRAEGCPYVCALQCGYIDRCPEHKFEPECDNCWRRPLEEVE